MIDIHCHILPGIDDGAADEQVALEMAKLAVSEGITKIVATPHHRNRHWDNPAPEVQQHVQRLNQQFKDHQIGLELLPGQEVRIFGEMADELETQDLMTVNSNNTYIMVEFPTHHVPRYAQQLFFELQVKGVTPVIVHPELNQELADRPNLLYAFINDGALSQVTAASLIGKNGRTAKKRAHQFIIHNLSHFVASDAHNTTHRPFSMQKAFYELKKNYGKDFANLFKENAELLINGELVNREKPVEIKKKKILGFF
ncbi:tyrosine-protein phosphatase [Sporolactobacillus terrae]|uniref:tyrosine-protein phosphatase n=1 Tax=Sporolactobacillus terrae TaxID=269673 RepID=UPI001CBF8912|nr:CpsB/CapC family capsule biosynthesis tyrosine phosphatase [Sporolactobacillus terrae]UAK16369.1 tyrosine protein phosphatase [Sporolactobacillus terrae]